MTPVPVGPLGPLNIEHLLGDQERALQQRLTRWLHGRAASRRLKDAGRLEPRQTSRGKLTMPGRRTPSRGKVSHRPGGQRHHPRLPLLRHANNLESVLTRVAPRRYTRQSWVKR
jgi:hypothetical protein